MGIDYTLTGELAMNRTPCRRFSRQLTVMTRGAEYLGNIGATAYLPAQLARVEARSIREEAVASTRQRWHLPPQLA